MIAFNKSIIKGTFLLLIFLNTYGAISKARSAPSTVSSLINFLKEKKKQSMGSQE